MQASANRNFQSEKVIKRAPSSTVVLSLSQLEQEFLNLKRKGMIYGDFLDSIWRMHSTTQHRYIKLSFQTVIGSDLIRAMKTYVVLRRRNHLVSTTVYHELRIIISASENSAGFNDFASLVRHYTELGDRRIYEVSRTMLGFLELLEAISEIDLSQYKEFFQTLEYVSSNRDNIRSLPDFQDVLNFQNVVFDYFDQNISMTIEYYPIFIWWKLTTVIPMRVIELLNLNNDCLSSRDGKKYISINRYKRKGSNYDERSTMQELEISSELFDVLQEYYDYLVRCGIKSKEDKFFFPPLDVVVDGIGSPKITDFVMVRYQLSNLLNKFIAEVVESKYYVYLPDGIRLGDTRHFAIINLFLQGYDALTIQRLAHHENMISSSHYYDHARFYASSYVRNLAVSSASDRVSEFIGGTIMPFDARKHYYKYEINKANLHSTPSELGYRPVQFGFCKNIEAPFKNCVMDCRLCDEKYYLFMPDVDELKEGVQWLSDKYKELDVKISSTFELLFSCYDTFKSDMEKVSEPIAQNEGAGYSVSLFSQLNQQALVLAKMIDIGIEEGL
jgi:hypothetical protein